MSKQNKIKTEIRDYENKIKNIDNNEASGNLTLDKLEKECLENMGEIDDKILKIDDKLQALNDFPIKGTIFFYGSLSFIIIGNIALFPTSLMAFFINSLVLSSLAVSSLMAFSKNFRLKVVTLIKNESKENLLNEKGNLLLIKNSFSKKVGKIEERINKRNNLDKELDQEIVAVRNEAEGMVESFYLDMELQELIKIVNQDIVNAEELNELIEAIKKLKKALQLLNKTRQYEKKVILSQKINDLLLDAEDLYSDIANEYENNKIRKLWGD